jgi:hypothetical protein
VWNLAAKFPGFDPQGGGGMLMAFKTLDEDGSGKITKAEWDEWVSNNGACKVRSAIVCFRALNCTL